MSTTTDEVIALPCQWIVTSPGSSYGQNAAAARPVTTRRKANARSIAASAASPSVAEYHDGARFERRQRTFCGEPRPRVGQPNRRLCRWRRFEAPDLGHGGGEVAFDEAGLSAGDDRAG